MTNWSSEILVSRKCTSPLFAALINGAASHFVEQDDLHNSSVLHPGTVVFPAVLAAAQAAGASGKQFIAADSGERDGHFLASCLRYEISICSVQTRLINSSNEVVILRRDIGFGYYDLSVIALKALGRNSGPLKLIQLRVLALEANRIGFNRP